MKSALLLLVCSTLYAQIVQILSPMAGSSVSGFAGAGNPNPPLITVGFATELDTADGNALACVQVDGNSLYNPGWGAPFATPTSNGVNLAALYAFGCFPVQPSASHITSFSMPWNSYWLANGNHVMTVVLYDAAGTLYYTSAPQPFVVANKWPVTCSDGSAPASSLGTPSVANGIISVPFSITGSCAGDIKSGVTGSPSGTTTLSWFVDGVTNPFSALFSSANTQYGGSFPNTTSSGTATIDERQWFNGVHNVCWAWLDFQPGNYSTSTGNNIGSAGEECLPQMFANGSVASQVWTAGHDIFLAPSATFSLAPTLYNTDQTTAGGTTFDYLSLNTSIATVSTGGVITATSACPGPGSGLPCSTQVFAMGESQGVGCSDLTNYLGTGQYTSTCFAFHTSDIGKLIKISGGTNCTAGLYQINNVDMRIPLVTMVPSPGPGGACVDASFVTGPTRASNVLINATNTMSCFGTDGAIHLSYTGSCFAPHEMFASGGILSGPNVTYPYAGVANAGPLAEFDTSGYNTWEVGLIGQSPCDGIGGTLSAFQSNLNSYISVFTPNLATLHHATHLYGAGDNVDREGTYLWNCAFGTPSTWTTPIVGAALNAWSGAGYPLVGVNMIDEGAGENARPLAGPITPGGSNSWLSASMAVVSDGTGTCTVNGTNIWLNSSLHFIIHGSSTTALNNSAGSAGYVGNVNGGSSFTFSCSLPSGTYSDSGLTIEPLAADGYTNDSNTSYIRYQAIANLVIQANTQTGTTPITWSAATTQPCLVRQNYGGLGTDGPIGGISQIGTSASYPYQDFYPDDSQAQPFLVSRNSINWNFTGGSSPGGFTRSQYGCYDPTKPLVTLVQADETLAGQQGYNSTLTSISGSTMTFSTGHGLQNVVPGITRVSVTGNSNSALNTNYFVLSILSPTELRVALAGTDFTSAACTNGTITFIGGHTDTPTSISATGIASVNKFWITGDGTNFSGYSYGQAFFVTNADATLPSLRGQNFTISGCTNAAFATPTFVYAPTNLNVPSYTVNGANTFWELPNGTGTGGTANIIPDDSSNCGRAYCYRPNENSPSFVFTNYISAAIAGAVGFRSYKVPGPNSRLYQPNYGFTINSAPPFAPTGITNEFYVFPHWENVGNVPVFHGNSLAAQAITRWFAYFDQPRLNSPDYGPWIDTTVRSGANGNLLLAANTTNGIETRTYNMATACNGSTCIQSGQSWIYNIVGPDGTNVIETESPSTTSVSITLTEGQAVFFVFPTTFTGVLTQPTFSPSTTGSFGDCPSGTDSIAIRWGYDLYLLDVSQQNVASYTSFPATIPADKNYGTVFGRSYCISSTAGTLATSDVFNF
jgi:hypothetical protein